MRTCPNPVETLLQKHLPVPPNTGAFGDVKLCSGWRRCESSLLPPGVSCPSPLLPPPQTCPARISAGSCQASPLPPSLWLSCGELELGLYLHAWAPPTQRGLQGQTGCRDVTAEIKSLQVFNQQERSCFLCVGLVDLYKYKRSSVEISNIEVGGVQPVQHQCVYGSGKQSFMSKHG